MKYLLQLLTILMLSGCSRTDNQTAVQWQPWEEKITVRKTPDGRPAEVDVVFSGPSGKTFTNHTFTDDGLTYVFRASFPSPGKWEWVTMCADTRYKMLDQRKGKVEVLPYEGDNPLYRHGDLEVSENGRYLVHADGTPFLWMGETGWRSTQNSSMEEWRYYINTRASQKFSVIQVSPKGVSKNPGKDLAQVSFLEDGRIDPLFWKDLEAKIEDANEMGIIIFMVGISKIWSDEFLKSGSNQPFERYITGRLAPYMVIFSPSFDEVFKKGNDSVAAELNKYTRHLVTQHPGTNYQANLSFRNSTSTDFCGMQSGHHGGRLDRAYNAARQWTLDMYNGTPVKPVINIEGMYDAYGDNSGKNWREKDVRKIGWISWLSGSKGYTYGAGDVPPKVPKGAGGVWRFNTDSTDYDYWKRAVHWKSAGQMTIMRDFFRTIDWWALEPAHDLVMNRQSSDTSMIVASVTADRKTILAYLPNNLTVELDLRSIGEVTEARWFDPATGNYEPIPDRIAIQGSSRFTRPEGWDDALLVLKCR